MRQSYGQTRQSDKDTYSKAEQACACLVNCPLFNPFDPSGGSDGVLMSVQMSHCFRFSVEYLLRSHLLRVSGGTAVKAPEKALATEEEKSSSGGSDNHAGAAQINEPRTPSSWEDLDDKTGPRTPVARATYQIQDVASDSENESPSLPEVGLEQTPKVALGPQSSGSKGGSRGGQLEPNDLAAFVAHLFFMEPSNFAFLSLLTADEGKSMRRLCRPGPDREVRVLSVLCNIFCRTRLPRPVADRARAYPATTGPSKVLLPGLDEIGENVLGADGQTVREGRLLKEILRQHNDDAVRVLVGYWACFVEAYSDLLGKDDTLPISGFRFLSPNDLHVFKLQRNCAFVDH